MKAVASWCGIVCLALWLPAAFGRNSKTVTVQLYGDRLQFAEGKFAEGTYEPIRTAFLILPDGSHAKALCFGRYCQIQPSANEKRVTVPCELLKNDETKNAHCYHSESYEAERKGNDITLRTVGGKVTYHIVGSW